MTDPETLGFFYYTALGEKKIEEVRKLVHPEIEFTDPQETVVGREAFLEAAKRFMKVFKSLTICEKFGSEEQAVIIYKVEIPSMEKNLRAASLLSFREELISKVELIYDTAALCRPSRS